MFGSSNGTVFNNHFNAHEYAQFFRNVLKLETGILIPLWEIRTIDLVFVLVRVDKGHHVYWFEDSNVIVRVLYKDLSFIEESEDALNWLVGDQMSRELVDGLGDKRIKRITRLGFYDPRKEKMVDNIVTFQQD